MSQAVQSNDEPSGELGEEQQALAIGRLDELIAQTQLQIKTEPDDEFLFDNLDCGDLYTPVSSQQVAGDDPYRLVSSQQITRDDPQTPTGQLQIAGYETPIDSKQTGDDPPALTDHQQITRDDPQTPTGQLQITDDDRWTREETSYWDHSQPTFSQSAYSQIAYDQSAYDHSSYDQSAFTQSVFTQPAHDEPTYSQRSHHESLYSPNNPTNSFQSVHDQSTHQSAYSQSTYSQSAYSQSNYSQSTYGQSTYSQSTYSQPTFSLPTYSQSAYSPSDQTVHIEDSSFGSLDCLPIEQSSTDQYDSSQSNNDSSLSSGQSIESSGQRIESSSQSIESSNQSIEQSSQSIGPSSQSIDPSTQSTEPSSQSIELFSQCTSYPYSTQPNDSGSLLQGTQQSAGPFVDGQNGEQLRRTVMNRLEILMKVLYGKGLFFDDRILVAKRCWENANFEGTIRMNYDQNDGLRYRRVSRSSRIALLMIAAKIYLLLAENRVSSRRQIYYEEKHLFSACRCYDLIEQVGAFVNLPRRALNVVASGKGLVAGSLVLLFENRTAIDVSQFRKGCLIPDSLIYLSEAITNARWILVVEKHAIFSKLVDAGFHLLYNAILITSKGFPDVYTRELVNILSDRLRLRTFGLFDCDPFGIDIYCCFKFGSVNLLHQSVRISSPRIVWIGIYPTEIAILRLKSVPFTETDERRLASLLKRVYLPDDQFLSIEIAYLGQMKVKCGLQDLEGNLITFILQKVSHYLALS